MNKWVFGLVVKKLTTLLANKTLNFKHSGLENSSIFCQKNVGIYCSAKAIIFFFSKNVSTYDLCILDLLMNN